MLPWNPQETTIEDKVRPTEPRRPKARARNSHGHRQRGLNSPNTCPTGQDGQRGLNSPNTCPTERAQKSHRWGRRRPNTYGRGPAVAYTNPQYLIHVEMLIRKDNINCDGMVRGPKGYDEHICVSLSIWRNEFWRSQHKTHMNQKRPEQQNQT